MNYLPLVFPVLFWTITVASLLGSTGFLPWPGPLTSTHVLTACLSLFVGQWIGPALVPRRRRGEETGRGED